MKHWRIDEVPWDRFERSKVAPDAIAIVKAAAMVERNGIDYAIYLKNVFHDDPAFRQAADNWSVEEVQHGMALGALGDAGRSRVGISRPLSPVTRTASSCRWTPTHRFGVRAPAN